MRRKVMIILLAIAGVLCIAIIALLLWSQPDGPPSVDHPSETAVATDTADIPAMASDPPSSPTGTPEAVQSLETAESPEDVIRYYFSCWNNKDTEGMDACRVEADRGLYSYDDVALEEAVELIGLTLETDEEALSQYDPAWYADPAEIALVVVDYTIHYNADGQAQLVRDTAEVKDYHFWLIKADEQSEWQIVMQGH